MMGPIYFCQVLMISFNETDELIDQTDNNRIVSSKECVCKRAVG